MFSKIKSELKLFKEKLNDQFDQDDNRVNIFFSFLNSQESRNFRPYLGRKFIFIQHF